MSSSKIALTLLFDDGSSTTVPLADGQSVLDALIAAGLSGFVEAACGGRGTCGTCHVHVVADPPPPSPADEKLLDPGDLEAGVRLACRFRPDHDMTVRLEDAPAARSLRTKESLVDGLRFAPRFELRPTLRKIHLSLPEPSLEDGRSDFARLRDALEGVVGAEVPANPPLALLRGLPAALRADDFRVTAVLHGGSPVAVEPGDTREKLLAVAVDVGTTSIAVYLLDLASGRQLSVAAGSNPQAAFGADVISRISAVLEDPSALGEMQRLVAGAVNGLVAGACGRAGVSPGDVYEAVLVGNTCMMQLFAGVNPLSIAASPYVPAFNEILALPAAEVGLSLNPAARACLLPGIGGYVGADIVADVLAADLHRAEGVRLLIDVGTNGEIVLARDGEVVTCATAAGPAFEGAHIECGMRAEAGAIERVGQDGEFRIAVIGGGQPRGVCGSGLLDAVAAMVRAGVVEPSGRFAPPGSLPPDLRPRIVSDRGGLPAFLLGGRGRQKVYVSQRDVRQLQMAKGAIRAGIEILLDGCALCPGDLDEVLLAGAFGSYITPQSALAIGMLPPVPPGHIRAVGNSAGVGAALAALSVPAREEAVEIARRSGYVELSVRKDFQDVFMRELGFPSASFIYA